MNTPSFVGVFPTVVRVSWVVLRSVAVAVIVVVPDLYVESKLAVAKESPCGMVIVCSIVPMVSADEAKVTVTSWGAFDTLLEESRSRTATCR